MDTTFFNQPNQHCLGSLMKATEKKTIIATEDIIDTNGLKLWAKGKPIAVSLQERLLAAKLKKPMEMCLGVEDGITSASVAEDMERIIAEVPSLALLIGNAASRIKQLLGHIKLSGLPQLLLTGQSVDDPAGFRHAEIAALVSAGIAWRMGLSDSLVEAAIVAGLLHDVGEMYVSRDLLRSTRDLTFEEWKGIAAHPRIGAVLLLEMAKCPAPVVRAVQEHHERLDGSGYPSGIEGAEISELGCILMASEMLSAVLLSKENPEDRALLAMRLVKGQFAPNITALITTTFHDHTSSMPTTFNLEILATTARAISERLQRCGEEARLLRGDAQVSEAAHELARQTQALCDILAASLHSTGVLSVLDSATDLQSDPSIAIELQVIIPELKWRMRALSRHVALAARNRNASETAFDAIIQSLYVADIATPQRAQ